MATLGYSIVLPILVYLVARLGGNAVVYGVMGATYSFFQLIGAPVLGRWSDRVGRKRILLLSQAGTAVSWALFLAALALPMTPIASARSSILGAFTLTVPLVVVFIARALDGITGGNVSVANAYLADITNDRDRAADFGKLALSANLGFIVGPALAGLLGATAWGEAGPVVGALLISTMACGMIVTWLGDTGATRSVRHMTPRGATAVLGQEPKDCYLGTGAHRPSTGSILALPGVALLLLLDLLVFLVFNVFYVAMPMHLARTLAWPLPETGLYFSVMSILMVVVEGPVLGWAARQWSERTLVIGGGLVLAVSFLFFVSSSVAVLYAGAAVLALGNGLMWPSLLALLAKAAGKDVQGAVQGLSGSAAALASIFGLLLGGVLFERIGADVFLLAAGITAVTCLISLRIGARVSR